MNRYGSFTVLAACAALTLSGCAGSGSDLYEGEQTAADVLPEDVGVEDYEWDIRTSRLLASHEEHEFDVLASTAGDDCLVTYDPRNPQERVVGCGAGGPRGTGAPTGGRTKFDPQGLPQDIPAGWTRLTPELEVTGT